MQNCNQWTCIKAHITWKLFYLSLFILALDKQIAAKKHLVRRAGEAWNGLESERWTNWHSANVDCNSIHGCIGTWAACRIISLSGVDVGQKNAQLRYDESGKSLSTTTARGVEFNFVLIDYLVSVFSEYVAWNSFDWQEFNCRKKIIKSENLSKISVLKVIERRTYLSWLKWKSTKQLAGRRTDELFYY